MIGAFVNTSGERNADVRVRVVRMVAVHVRTVGIEVADVHELAVQIAPRLILRLAICGIIRSLDDSQKNCQGFRLFLLILRAFLQSGSLAQARRKQC